MNRLLFNFIERPPQHPAPNSASVMRCDIIVAKNLDKSSICPDLRLDLRLLTHELGGRIHYGYPFCVFHVRCLCTSKALTASLSLHACNAVSPRRRATLSAALRSACMVLRHTIQQNVCW